MIDVGIRTGIKSSVKIKQIANVVIKHDKMTKNNAFMHINTITTISSKFLFINNHFSFDAGKLL